MKGYLAYSLAGHDKGEVFLIIKEEESYVYVCDGRLRLIEKPKKKNKKHIQIIKNFVPNIDTETATNVEIKHIIKLYCNGIKEVKQCQNPM